MLARIKGVWQPEHLLGSIGIVWGIWKIHDHYFSVWNTGQADLDYAFASVAVCGGLFLIMLKLGHVWQSLVAWGWLAISVSLLKLGSELESNGDWQDMVLALLGVGLWLSLASRSIEV